MYTKLIIDGDAVYETDEECLKEKKKEHDTEERGKKREQKK